MKRQPLFITICVAIQFLYIQTIFGQNLNVKDCTIATGFYTLWKKSFFGKHPDHVETGAWIRSNPDLGYEFLLWEITPERERVSWHEQIPNDVLAQAHTHPDNVEAKPSSPDQAIAKKLNIPVYTISRRGIWKADPDGTVVQVADKHWYKVAKSCSQPAAGR
jgi:hypothetical protein